MADTLYLVPVGAVAENILRALCQELAATFGRCCEVARAMPHPSYAYDDERDQYLSGSILERLRQLVLPEAFRLLGVVNQDLYVPELNFVFGQATMGGREALIALPRLRQSFYGLPDDVALFQHRVLKEAIHELGHTLGLSHCGNRRCVMHFSNSLSDTDIKGQDLCLNCRSLLEDEQ